MLNEDKVAATVQGRVVLFRCNLKQYKAAHATWLESLTAKEAKKRLLKEVIDPVPAIKVGNEEHTTKTKKRKIKHEVAPPDTEQASSVDNVGEIDELFRGITNTQPSKKEKTKTKKKKFQEEKSADSKDKKVRHCRRLRQKSNCCKYLGGYYLANLCTLCSAFMDQPRCVIILLIKSCVFSDKPIPSLALLTFNSYYKF